MIQEKVQEYFNRFTDLRILFFFDENQEFLEEVEKLELPDIQVTYWQNNPFSLKCQLLDDLKDAKVLLYLPMAHPNNQEAYHKFPLMGLLLANKELQLDSVGGFMEDYGLQRHQKALVSKYIKELKYAGVQDVCAPILNAGSFTEPALQKGLVSSFLKFKTIESWPILVAKLVTLSDSKEAATLQKVIKKISDLHFEEEVMRHIQEVTGHSIQKINQEALLQVARSILYNKLTQTLSAANASDPYKAFKINDTTQLTRLNQMLQGVDRISALKSSFDQLLQQVSKDIKGAKLIDLYGEDAQFAEFNTDMIWAVLTKVQAHIGSSPKEIIKKLETLSLQQDLDSAVKACLRYVIQVAKMHQLIGDVPSYVLDRPEEYVHLYTNTLYKIDGSYRRAIASYKNLDIPEIPKAFGLEQIHTALNSEYDKHTDILNREWLKCLDHFDFDYSKINVPKQYDFYDTEIATTDQKVVVIISDALRYEAGIELLSEMHGDSKNTAEMRYMLASIPSKTNVGMAQLLPGKEKTFNEGDIKSDGLSTSGTDNRSKILQTIKEDALAVQFANVEGLNQADNRKIFKSSVVYVYHDVIDATGDKKASERRTFDAVEDSIKELKKFVKTLHVSSNVAKVFITADHGFLYNDEEIKEKDKENIGETSALNTHNRYYLTKAQSSPELGYSIPFSATSIFKDDLFVTIPFSVNRYKKQGVGHQFVHGGGSLQELVVPLIESSRKLKDVTKKVTPVIINKGALKIVSNILKLNILQEQEVSRTEKERTLSIGLYKDSKLVSNEEQLKLNFTSESPSERMARIELTLASELASEPFLKLKIFDIDDTLNPLIEERIQNNTLIQPDF
ncbi:BREX-1 system phosphatase PglZ type A [Algibacter sp.]|nr:BREX-1 system phosphatase PglZ type A [Algibacter sp.]